MRTIFLYQAMFFVSLLLTFAAYGQDAVADNMLLYQRGIGGWPKHINEVKVDYTKALFAEEKKDLLADKYGHDATIDNGATNKEICYLVKAYKIPGNKACLKVAEKGIR